MARPKKYETPEEMERAIKEYFDEITVTCIDDEGNEYKKYVRPPTVTGLAYALGVTRQTLLNYQNEYDEKFLDTITRAKTKIEMYAEEQLYRQRGSTNGVQFNLKNNFNWEDKKVQQHEGDGVINVTLEDD